MNWMQINVIQQSVKHRYRYVTTMRAKWRKVERRAFRRGGKFSSLESGPSPASLATSDPSFRSTWNCWTTCCCRWSCCCRCWVNGDRRPESDLLIELTRSTASSRTGIWHLKYINQYLTNLLKFLGKNGIK